MSKKNYDNIVDETIGYLNEKHNFEGTSLHKYEHKLNKKYKFSNKFHNALFILIALNIIIFCVINFKQEAILTSVSKATSELLQVNDKNPLLMHSIKQITEAKNRGPGVMERELRNNIIN